MNKIRHMLFGDPAEAARKLAERQKAHAEEASPLRGEIRQSVQVVQSGSHVLQTMAGMMTLMNLNSKVDR